MYGTQGVRGPNEVGPGGEIRFGQMINQATLIVQQSRAFGPFLREKRNALLINAKVGKNGLALRREWSPL